MKDKGKSGFNRISVLFLSVCCVLVSKHAAATEVGLKAIEEATVFQRRLEKGNLTPKEMFELANSIGPVIDGVRQTNTGTENLTKLRDILDTMRLSTEGYLSQIEADAQESEAALERLYRSQDWDDISFALAAFPYWRAWIDLELAKREKDPGLKITALLPAQKGFRTASMQMFRPGLVYGGWLGMGYLELERGRQKRAMEIFESLDTALASEPDSPVRQAVKLELRLLEVQTGKVKPRTISRKLDDTEAKLLRAEAFALLQSSRKTGGRPLGAAERLSAIIESGRMDQSLLSDMMIYAQELSGVNVGIYTDLAGAEFALEYKHFYQAMQKYESFFTNVVPPANLDLTYWRYRWAVAAYGAKIYQPAVDILEKLSRRKGLPEDLDRSVTKLLYGTYAAREQMGGSSSNRKKLRAAAKSFVRKSPKDKDADAARLLIAQTTSDAGTAMRTLNNISARSSLKGELERTAYHIIARDFSKKVARGKIRAAKGLARDGVNAFQKLPKADKADPFNFAILLQMRALVDPKPEEVLKAIDFIEKKENTNLDIRRALAWSRLQLYDRMGDTVKVREYIEENVRQGVPSWKMEFLYPFVAGREDREERVDYARLLQRASTSQPSMDRRFRALIIEDLLYLEAAEDAYSDAKDFAKQFPASGDAWKLLGKAAEAVEKPYEADRAWRVITDKAVPTMTVWWEGMISRIRIRTNSTRPEDACPLVKEILRSETYMPDNLRKPYETAAAATSCEAVQSAALE